MASPAVFRRPISPTAGHSAQGSSATSVIRAICASLMAANSGNVHKDTQIWERNWPQDDKAYLVLKAVSGPATTTGMGR